MAVIQEKSDEDLKYDAEDGKEAIESGAHEEPE
jgi:hypothetical protein